MYANSTYRWEFRNLQIDLDPARLLWPFSGREWVTWRPSRYLSQLALG